MILVVILFFVLLAMKMPLAFSIGISTITFYLLEPGLDLGIAVQRMVTTTQSFTMLAIPFFIIAGNLMNASGITDRLVKFSNKAIGHLFGGLACVSCLLSAVMGGISGSAVADATMEARILSKPMLERGYSKGYTAAVISLSSTITATIPPSVGLIIFGAVGGVSIGRLFVGGIVPGILMTITLLVPSYFIAKKRGYAREREKMTPLPDLALEGWKCIWALLFPVLLIVGIRFGVFTASEAGAFAIVYALFVGFFIYKELTWKKLKAVFSSSIRDCAIVLFITVVASTFGFASTYSGLPQGLATALVTITDNKYLMACILLVFLFIMGMFMESTVNTMLFTPIFLPIMIQMGMDAIHFGIMFELMVILGAMTPPVGTAMISVCDIVDCSVEDYIKESFPFFLCIFALFALMLFVPDIVLFLPNLVYG